jgi:hypothetical protein
LALSESARTSNFCPSLEVCNRSTERRIRFVHELKHAIVGGNEVVERKVPIDGMLQCRLADGVRDLCHFADTDCAADSDNASVDRLFRGTTIMVTLPPVL